MKEPKIKDFDRILAYRASKRRKCSRCGHVTSGTRAQRPDLCGQCLLRQPEDAWAKITWHLVGIDPTYMQRAARA